MLVIDDDDEAAQDDVAGAPEAPHGDDVEARHGDRSAAPYHDNHDQQLVLAEV